MRSVFVGIVLAGLAVAPSVAVGQRVVSIDIKTRLSDKSDVSAIEAGLRAHIAVADWIATKERGEDYALWLGAFKRIREGQLTTVLLTVELRTRSEFRQGAVLDSRDLRVVFSPADQWMGSPLVKDSVDRALRHRRDQGHALTMEALVVGERVLQAAREMIGAR